MMNTFALSVWTYQESTEEHVSDYHLKRLAVEQDEKKIEVKGHN